MADEPALRGLIDTSVVIDLESVAPDTLPSELSIAAVTLAELAAGPHATDDPTERARRQECLQRAEATFDAIPFDAAAARAYGRVYAEVAAVRRATVGARFSPVRGLRAGGHRGLIALTYARRDRDPDRNADGGYRRQAWSDLDSMPGGDRWATGRAHLRSMGSPAFCQPGHPSRISAAPLRAVSLERLACWQR